MLDSITKKRIDDLRDILVGKVPDPKSQVEQITTALIYKFMYDMDEEAVEMGGVPSFFVGDYEKYSWKNLFDAKLGGAEKVQLYSDAIENMYTNPTAPPLFREIFKNSFLPFKDPSTLNMFLKEVDEFHYSHSEKLGDAFEYLLSFMGSQGDAGQFRTPRHIIDFIVEIVSPQKNETILDPACGTAGFLISSYKHILSQNTDKRVGDQLTASDRKNIGDNLVGYDISPDMNRISLVNMYLHQFASPQIHEYDSLSSEDRWNEYFDVILANPPFMTPKGGIKPHQRFGVKSNRAEVLFVDYIMEHLKPNGRAGIVVPEGIIFQTGTAYKTLRKKLVEDCLIGVISLPVGVFQPYSGVKTSILILDKELNRKSESIFFAKVENDGFTLNSNRTPIKGSDLASIVASVSDWLQGSDRELFGLTIISRDQIVVTKDCSLSSLAYQEQIEVASEHPVVALGEVCDFEGGTQPPKSTFIDEEKDGYIRLIQIRDYKSDKNKVFIPTTERHKKCSKEDIMIGRYGPPVFQILRGLEGAYNVALMRCIPNQNKISREWLFYILNSDRVQKRIIGLSERVRQSGVRPDDLKTQNIPLPPIEVQQEIVDELEGYQKIIDGCRQVVENYKPTIDIDPSWEMIELSECISLQNGYAFSSKDMHDEGLEGTLPVIKIGNVGRDGTTSTDCKFHPYTEKLENFQLVENDLVVAMTGATVGKVSTIPKGKYLLNQRVGKLVIKNDSFCLDFVKLCVLSNRFYNYCQSTAAGGAQGNISGEQILKFLIPKLNSDEQAELVNHQGQIQLVIDGNKKLIEIYTQKIQDRISRVWGE